MNRNDWELATYSAQDKVNIAYIAGTPVKRTANTNDLEANSFTDDDGVILKNNTIV